MAKLFYIKVEKTIHQPLEKVWQVVALGFGNVSVYNPEIKSSRLDSEKKEGVGTKRHCDFKNKGYIKEEIIEWNEMESFKLTFTESSVPMAVLESKFSFSKNGSKTNVTQEFWYRLKAPMGWLSGLMKGKMRSTLENGLTGLDRHLSQN